MNHILDVYFHEKLVGKLTQDRVGHLSFKYTQSYLEEKNAPAISISMPLQSESYNEKTVRPFFSGFLPDGVIRDKIAHFLGVSEQNPFALLGAIGGECAGALSFYNEGKVPEKPEKNDIEILDDKSLAGMLEKLKRQPLLVGEQDIRLSLAGAQDKVAVCMVNGKVAIAHGTTPTTHILKPMIENLQDTVYNELFCMKLAKLLEIEAPVVEVKQVSGIPYFLVERYDRAQKNEKEVIRLHQEDFCQALSIPPEKKYQNEGGPTVAQCLAILQKHSARPGLDQVNFIKLFIFNYLIGNADAHGKNFSLLYTSRYPILAPAYDLMCTAIYPGITKKMAMKIGSTYDPETIFMRHWKNLFQESFSVKQSPEKLLKNMSKECIEQAKYLKTDLQNQGIYSDVFEQICTVIEKRQDHICH